MGALTARPAAPGVTGVVTRRSRRVALLAAVAVLGVLSVVVVAGPQGLLPPTDRAALSNALQLMAPALAATSCLVVSRQQGERRRRAAWCLLGLGAAGWALGQLVFAYLDVVRGVPVAVPGLPDVGFLSFPVLATAGTLLLPHRALTGTSALRLGLDGAVVATSLLVLGWSFALRHLWAAGGDGATLLVTTAYPVTDVMLVAVVVLLVVRSRGQDRRALLPLAAGLAAFGVADGAYVVLTSSGGYVSGAWADLGWIAGFLLLAVAAALAQVPAGDAHPLGTPYEAPELVTPTWTQLLLPYAPVAAAIVVVLVRVGHAEDVTPAEGTLAGVLALLVLGRQFVALADNRVLVRQLHLEREEARHLSLHDPLTGLPNRQLFVDRLDQALAANRRYGTPLSVLFCDLDHFKAVNDTHGHAAGDAVLVAAAARMRAVLREGDTLGRLGGDEFGVLLAATDRADVVARELVAAMRPPVEVAGRFLLVTLSVGAASVSAEDAGRTADDLLVTADRAMYVAKDSGRDGFLLAGG